MTRPDFSDFDPEWADPAAWAGVYRACGLQVVPAHDPNPHRAWKFPRVAWIPLQDRIADGAQFNGWYGAGGRYQRTWQMGTVTGRCSGNVFVVDLDLYKSPDAATWWSAVLASNHGIEPETWEQRTGGGGRQIFFRAPPGWECISAQSALGVDIRGWPGFVMLPPSQHTSGRRYEWVQGREPWSIDVAVAEDWLLNAVGNLIEHYGPTFTGQSEAAQRPSGVVLLRPPSRRPKKEKPANSTWFNRTNDAAIASAEAIEAWAPRIFPVGRWYKREGFAAYRVSSRDLGRDLQEDLAITTKGIVDWGEHDQDDPRYGSRTAIGGGGRSAHSSDCGRVVVPPARA